MGSKDEVELLLPDVLMRTAQERLAEASASGSRTVIGPGALSALLRLAESPEFSSDALRLLHELNVHQVELDMLRDELARRPERF